MWPLYTHSGGLAYSYASKAIAENESERREGLNGPWTLEVEEEANSFARCFYFHYTYFHIHFHDFQAPLQTPVAIADCYQPSSVCGGCIHVCECTEKERVFHSSSLLTADLCPNDGDVAASEEDADEERAPWRKTRRLRRRRRRRGGGVGKSQEGRRRRRRLEDQDPCSGCPFIVVSVGRFNPAPASPL